MEENRRFSWTDLFVKVIIIAVFILFTIWLLSLSNKGLSNSLDVLTDDIFVQNIERMKEVGKEYFTIERLPEKIGEMKTLTLKEMYEKKLILEIKDKNGNVCDAEDSYVTIEKMENEYQMKVNLECNDKEDYIVVIMGCYDYCDTDICEKKEEIVEDKEIEYEYKKTTGGSWTAYGNWSEWSKVSITSNDYRQVETKKVNEEYTYDKVVVNTLFEEYDVTCPNGYTLNSSKTKCYKTTSSTDTTDPVCATISGYTFIGRDGFTCNYSKQVSSTANVESCPSVKGYKLTGRNGLTCNYTKTTTTVADPVACPKTNGDYTLTSQNGFTCNYSKEVTTSYQETVLNPKTCYSQKVVISCTGCAPVIQNVPYDCSTSSVVTKYKTETKTTSSTVGCPTGYDKVDGVCTKTTTDNKTQSTSCSTGYTYNSNADNCIKNSTENKTETATCPNGYTKVGNTCSKTITGTDERNVVKTCPSGYNETSDKTKCYKNENTTVKETGTKEVTYYRYRVRQYVGGAVDYKWSKSNNDQSLLNAGYKLTGKTRYVLKGGNK